MYIHTVGWYSEVKKNEVPVLATTWKKLENIMLSLRKPITKGNIVYDSVYMKCLE